MQPLYDSLKDMIPSEKLKKFMEDEVIQIAPLAFMRGRTLDNAFVILDEGQNTTHSQMKMFLTRMGKNAKFIVTGDPGQMDLPKGISGINEAIKILKSKSSVKFVESMDVSINLGVDAKKSDQNIRGSIVLPNGTGKTVKVAVFCEGDEAKKALNFKEEEERLLFFRQSFKNASIDTCLCYS